MAQRPMAPADPSPADQPTPPPKDPSLADQLTDMLVDECDHLLPGSWERERIKDPSGVYQRIHALPEDQKPTALCLSGGGIRSATFGLGVLQAFARSGRLQRFHYLSTVSGGGYIGSWLTNWLSRKGWNWAEVEPLLCQKPSAASQALGGSLAAEHDPINRLRAYSNYLSPVRGLSTDVLSLIAIFLRNLLLNWLVWLPLLAALVMLPRLFVALAALQIEASREHYVLALAVLSALAVAVGIAYVVKDLPGDVPASATAPTSQEQIQGKQNRFARYCFAPLLLAAMVLSVLGVWLMPQAEPPGLDVFMLSGVGVHVLGVGIGMLWRRRRNPCPRRRMRNLFGSFMVLVGGALGGGLLWLAMRHAGPDEDAPGDKLLLYATFSVPMLLACFWVTMALYAGIVRRWTSEEDREWWSRATAWWLYASLVWATLFGLILYLPALLMDRLSMELPASAQVGLAGTLLGVITSAVGYWSKNGTELKRRASTWTHKLGLRLLDLMAAAVIVALLASLSLLVGALLEQCNGRHPWLCSNNLGAETAFTRHAAMLASQAGATGDGAHMPPGHSVLSQAYVYVLLHAEVKTVLAVIVGLGALAVFMSVLIGVNTFSLHGLYGNRLVRAYLGAGRDKRDPHWFSGFDPQDNRALEQVMPPRKGQRPLHVLNMALNLVQPSSERLAWQQRKAASFTATPQRCGSDSVGYVRTAQYGDRETGIGAGITLGRALTISGAAASPNMGYHSSALVAFVMTLFNVRLGWWLPNPARKHPASLLTRAEPLVGIVAMLSEAFSQTTHDRASVYLSDGGHFENLGLYEMVRRRCHRIVVVDATADPNAAWADLLDAVRKIRVDFGIPIELPALLPGPGRAVPPSRLVVGRIRYSERDGNGRDGKPVSDGELYVLKPCLLGTEPPDLAHYAQVSSKEGSVFPHQRTSDQFFDETQFESYRMLGLISAQEAFPDNDTDWPGAPAVPAPPQAAAAPAAQEPAPAPRTVSTGTAVAAALAVGSALGVAGTAALAPPTQPAAQAAVLQPPAADTAQALPGAAPGALRPATYSTTGGNR